MKIQNVSKEFLTIEKVRLDFSLSVCFLPLNCINKLQNIKCILHLSVCFPKVANLEDVLFLPLIDIVLVYTASSYYYCELEEEAFKKKTKQKLYHLSNICLLQVNPQQ